MKEKCGVECVGKKEKFGAFVESEGSLFHVDLCQAINDILVLKFFGVHLYERMYTCMRVRTVSKGN